MLNPNSSVEAVVESVKVFGVYLRHENDRILVLAVETGDTSELCRSRMASFAVGELVTVTILRYIADKDLYVATMKSS